MNNTPLPAVLDCDDVAHMYPRECDRVTFPLVRRVHAESVRESDRCPICWGE